MFARISSWRRIARCGTRQRTRACWNYRPTRSSPIRPTSLRWSSAHQDATRRSISRLYATQPRTCYSLHRLLSTLLRLGAATGLKLGAQSAGKNSLGCSQFCVVSPQMRGHSITVGNNETVQIARATNNTTVEQEG